MTSSSTIQGQEIKLTRGIDNDAIEALATAIESTHPPLASRLRGPTPLVCTLRARLPEESVRSDETKLTWGVGGVAVEAFATAIESTHPALASMLRGPTALVCAIRALLPPPGAICHCGHTNSIHTREYAWLDGEKKRIDRDACTHEDCRAYGVCNGFAMNREASVLAGALDVPENERRWYELQAKQTKEAEGMVQQRREATAKRRTQIRADAAHAPAVTRGTMPNQNEIDRRPFAEATFRNGELAIVVHTEASAYRLHERKHTAIALTVEATATLARALLSSLPPETALILAREVFACAESA